MAIAKCVFCGVEQEDYKGTYLIKNDGSTIYFSSGKCMKNFLKLGRDKRKVRWTEAFHEQRTKRLAKEKEAEDLRKKKKGEKEAKKMNKKQANKEVQASE